MDEAEALFPADKVEEAVAAPGGDSGGPGADEIEEAAVAGDEALEVPLTDVDEDEDAESEPDAESDEPSPPAESEESTPPTLDEMVAELAGSVTATSNSEEPAIAADQAVAENPEAVAEPAVDEGESAAEAQLPAASASETALGPITDRMWTRVPFWTAFGLFPVVTGVSVYLLWPAATGAFTATPLYHLFVAGGTGLVLVSLVTGLVVGFTARARAGHDGRAGLARAIWLRMFVWTAAGVAVWWIGLVLLDLHHAGVI